MRNTSTVDRSISSVWKERGGNDTYLWRAHRSTWWGWKMMLSESRGVVVVSQNNDTFPATLRLPHFRIFPSVGIKQRAAWWSMRTQPVHQQGPDFTKTEFSVRHRRIDGSRILRPLLPGKWDQVTWSSESSASAAGNETGTHHCYGPQGTGIGIQKLALQSQMWEGTFLFLWGNSWLQVLDRAKKKKK